MQEWLARAADELGVRVEIGRVVTLSDGMNVGCQALFPDLGNVLGTLVFDSDNAVDSGVRRELVAQGYGMSTFSEPLAGEVFDLDGYAQMFAEWGWTGSASKRPTWMT
jgi:hypothetical protein